MENIVLGAGEDTDMQARLLICEDCDERCREEAKCYGRMKLGRKV